MCVGLLYSLHLNLMEDSKMQHDLLRLPQVLARVGYSRSTLYAKIKIGEFPAPISLGARSVAWISGEIDEWIDRQIKESRKHAKERPASLSQGG